MQISAIECLTRSTMIICFVVSLLHAQEWTYYNTNTGDEDVRSVAIDINGDKWFGTYTGYLIKFDGEK